jgi:ABC-type Mn2+/Zn2+ transport system ATPase subunit
VSAPPAARAGGPALEARGLGIGYAGTAVVEGLDLVLERGRTLALVGANGSGKSTLLKTVAALLPPLRGELRVLGAAPGASPARVAYLGQFRASSGVLPLRAIDVVRMGRYAVRGLTGRMTAEDARQVAWAMERMGVSDVRDEPLDALSGGQRQRVLIAQALARGAELLLLDEPAANLDARGRATYRQVLQEATAAGCSVVVATHDVEEAARSDLAMLLARRVVSFGPGAEVLTAEALLSTFGVVARRGPGGVLVVEHDHHHECDCGAPVAGGQSSLDR